MKKEKPLKLSPKHGVNPMLGQCPLCGGDTNELFLLGKLPNDEQAPRQGVVPHLSEPCATCKDNMTKGIMLIVCRDGSDQKNPFRTGQIFVINEKAAQRIFNVEIIKHRAAFIEHSVAIKIGLIKPEEK